MPRDQSFVARLLRAYHKQESVCEESGNLPDLDQVVYLCNVGLGPIAFRTYGDALQSSAPDCYSMLLSADLTTRVIYKQMEKALLDLLRRLQKVEITPVLLKGGSTAFEYYSPSHLRLMGDLDILVKSSEATLAMQQVAALGYRTTDKAWLDYRSKHHHHLPAAHQAKSGVMVEVHTSLFRPDLPFAQEPLFHADNLDQQRAYFDYQGVRCARFTPEFQLAFTVAKWGIDANWAVNLTSINDTIHILRKHEDKLDWAKLRDWTSNSPGLRSNLYALLKYLEQSEIFSLAPNARRQLINARHFAPSRTTGILMWLLHNYPFNARARERSDYSRWRGKALWQEFTKPDRRDTDIPLVFLRVFARSIHHGKYNPLNWLLAIFRRSPPRLTQD